MPRSFIHPVTKEYLAKLETGGFTLASDRVTEIDQFVSQLSRIVPSELWVCWPMRVGHNAGTGVTVYSLGKLGNYNGTMGNGPTWGANGITFSQASNQYISTPLVIDSLSYSVIGGLNNVSVSTNRLHGWSSLNNSDQGIIYRARQAATSTSVLVSFGTVTNVQTASSYIEGTPTINATIIDNSLLKLYVDATAPTSVSYTNPINYNMSLSPFMIGHIPQFTPDRGYNGTISFILLIKAPISTSEYNNIRDIVKTTIGKGLSFP